jgi:hypothetical protein
MKTLRTAFTRLYAALLYLYPAGFRADFGEEMESVFKQVVSATNGLGGLARLGLRELRDLPVAVLNERVERIQGGQMSTIGEERLSPSSHGEAILGALPFMAFGLATILAEISTNPPVNFVYLNLGFYVLVLVGLGVGWVKGFPLWSYAYLGWALVFAWWWTGMHTVGVRFFGIDIQQVTPWGLFSWLLLGLTAFVALLWTRSLEPIKRLFTDSWRDWTRLSLGMYSFAAFVLLIYDENHHPYLLAFMVASTLLHSAGAWAFLRSRTVLQRVLSLAGSMIVGMIINWVCYATWDYAAYYGLTKTTKPWYVSLWGNTMMIVLWLGILLWPAVVGGMRRVMRRKSNGYW